MECVFVIYGEPGDWATLLWPHRWALYSEDVFINNVQVYDYMFMLSESWYYNVGFYVMSLDMC